MLLHCYEGGLGKGGGIFPKCPMPDPPMYYTYRMEDTFVSKANGKTSVKNYCPISLLCNVSKVLGRLIIYDKLYSVVSKHVSLCQFGFQRNISTLQLLLFFHELVKSINL